MNKIPYLADEEHKKALSCVENILDKIMAIKSELSNEKAYRSYLAEKISSVLWDANCINSMCNVRGEDETRS